MVFKHVSLCKDLTYPVHSVPLGEMLIVHFWQNSRGAPHWQIQSSLRKLGAKDGFVQALDGRQWLARVLYLLLWSLPGGLCLLITDYIGRMTAFSWMFFFYHPLSASAQQSSLNSLMEFLHRKLCPSNVSLWELPVRRPFPPGLLQELKAALSTWRYFLSREGSCWGRYQVTLFMHLRNSQNDPGTHSCSFLIHVNFCVIQIHLPKGIFGMWSYFLHGLVWDTPEFTHLRSEPIQCCSVAPAGHGSLGLSWTLFYPLLWIWH